MRIGVLDDVPMMADLLQAILELGSYPVCIYHSAFPFLDMLCRAHASGDMPYDLLLLGSHPSTQFCWKQLLQHIRMTCAALPVVLLSTEASYEIHLHPDLYPHVTGVKEPFSVQELYDLITTLEPALRR